jgi:hypothetical protein
MEMTMTATFPLTHGRDEQALLAHLASHHLMPPSNCTITVHSFVAVVHSLHTFALGTARTAW